MVWTGSVLEIVSATGGRVSGTRDQELTPPAEGVSINSRTLEPGQLFIAIKGQRFDGHRFLPEAQRRGASAAVVSSRLRAEIPLIVVKDTTRALGLLARRHRERFDLPVIGITGSAGKTTLKEMLAGVLSSRGPVLKNAGTENNHIGVPLTLLRLGSEHKSAVIEMGTNRPGDIPWLSGITRPTMAVLTNIGESHLALLKTPALVFKEKAALIRAVPPDGEVVLNADDRFLSAVPGRDRRHRCVTYGIEQKADYRADRIRLDPQSGVHFRLNGRHEVCLPSPVLAWVPNALAAIACGRGLGIPLKKIFEALAVFTPPARRQHMSRVGGCWIIDDSYNANPVSFRSSLQTLAALEVPGRRILVCGDMLELGSSARRLHEEVGALAGGLKLDLILTCGEWAEYISRAAQACGSGLETRHYRRPAHLARILTAYCRPGDAVLIKGSRGMRMERVVEGLTAGLARSRGSSKKRG